MKINFANIEVRGSQPSVWYVYLLTVKENEDAVVCGNRNMKKSILFFHPVIILIEYSLRTVILFPQMLKYGWLYRDFHG